jgi:uncharacterized protein with von Willebrand factor type A (vWA) domain
MKELQNRLSQLEEAEIYQAQKEVREEMQKSLDSDAEIGKLSTEQKSFLRDRVFEEEVRSLLADGRQYSPQLLRDALETVRETAGKLGLLNPDPKSGGRESIAEEVQPLMLGLGKSGAKMMDSIRRGDPGERPKITDPGYDGWLLAKSKLRESQSRG